MMTSHEAHVDQTRTFAQEESNNDNLIVFFFLVQTECELWSLDLGLWLDFFWKRFFFKLLECFCDPTDGLGFLEN